MSCQIWLELVWPAKSDSSVTRTKLVSLHEVYVLYHECVVPQQHDCNRESIQLGPPPKHCQMAYLRDTSIRAL